MISPPSSVQSSHYYEKKAPPRNVVEGTLVRIKDEQGYWVDGRVKKSSTNIWSNRCFSEHEENHLPLLASPSAAYWGCVDIKYQCRCQLKNLHVSY